MQLWKKKYCIQKRIFELATNSFVMSYQNQLNVEIDAEHYENLLKDLTSKLYTKILKSRRVEETLVMIVKWEIYIEQLKFINKKIFYFLQMAQQQYLTNYKMI